MKNIIVGQSGGPTAVINGSLYGVTSEGLKHADKIEHVYGMVNGIEGFLNDQVMDMGALSKTGELEFVKTTPGAYLGSWSLQTAGRSIRSGISSLVSKNGREKHWILFLHRRK